MELLISQITPYKKYSKARRRLSQKLSRLSSLLSKIHATSFPSGIIIMVVDKPVNYLEVIQNKEGFFEVHVGFDWSLTFLPQDDEEYLRILLLQIEKSFSRYPGPEKETFLTCLKQYEKTVAS